MAAISAGRQRSHVLALGRLWVLVWTTLTNTHTQPVVELQQQQQQQRWLQLQFHARISRRSLLGCLWNLNGSGKFNLLCLADRRSMRAEPSQAKPNQAKPNQTKPEKPRTRRRRRRRRNNDKTGNSIGRSNPNPNANPNLETETETEPTRPTQQSACCGRSLWLARRESRVHLCRMIDGRVGHLFWLGVIYVALSVSSSSGARSLFGPYNCTTAQLYNCTTLMVIGKSQNICTAIRNDTAQHNRSAGVGLTLLERAVGVACCGPACFRFVCWLARLEADRLQSGPKAINWFKRTNRLRVGLESWARANRTHRIFDLAPESNSVRFGFERAANSMRGSARICVDMRRYASIDT